MIGKAIQHFRESSGLTKSELATRAGLSPASITQYENGNRNPSEDNLLLIAEALNVAVSQIKERADSFTRERNQLAHGVGMVRDESEDYQARKRKDLIYRNNDIVVELTEDLLLGFRVRAHDIPYEIANREKYMNMIRRSPFDRQPSIIEAALETVIRDLLADYSEEIHYRMKEQLDRANFTLTEAVTDLRNKLERY